jgi:hypothetical protein
MAVEAGLSFEKRRRFQYNLHFRFRDGGDNPSPRGHSRGGQRAYDHGNFAGKHPRVLPWVDDANSTRSKDKVVAARPAFERIVVGQADMRPIVIITIRMTASTIAIAILAAMPFSIDSIVMIPAPRRHAQPGHSRHCGLS